MTGEKQWFLSKGFIGGILAALAGVLGLFGIHVPEGETQSLTALILEGITAGTGILAAVGRLLATKKLV